MFSLGAASKEKGIGTALSDTIIKTKISNITSFQRSPKITLLVPC